MGDAQGGFAEVAASRRGIGQVLGSVVTAAVALVVGQRRRVVDASAEVAEINFASGAAVSTIETLSVLMSMTCCGAAADTVFAAKAAIRGISSFSYALNGFCVQRYENMRNYTK